MRESMTEESREMFSAEAIWVRRWEVEMLSRGLKRNLEQREARGSMILCSQVFNILRSAGVDGHAPRNVVTHETKPCYTSIVLHYST